MTIDLNIARRLLNARIMEDRAWRHEFGHVVPYRQREVMMSLILAATLEPGGMYPPQKRLVPRVMEALDVKSQQTAEKYIEETRMARMLTTRRSETDRRVVHYVFSEDVLETLLRIENWKAVIAEVVSRQIENPDDPNAGSELLPAAIYYNTVSAEAA